MNIDHLLNEISKKYAPLSAECKQDFIDLSKLKTYKRGDVVVREGQYSHKAYLIIKGCARAYYLKDGKDITDWFTFENQFMASIVSFFGDQPSTHFVEFVEDTEVIEFTRSDVEVLSEQYREFERVISAVVTETMLGLCERLYTIQFNKAEERYRHLTSIHPGITRRIPLTHIASYLGITLETLSRIRNPKMLI